MTPFASSEGPAADAIRSAERASGDGRPQAARVTLLLFAAAREAAGTGREEILAGTVGEALDQARLRYGEHFSGVLDRSRVWLNGDPVAPEQLLGDGDELAVLPPVSGG
jgi:sulfur-carrier protein